ncbi:MAG: helicase [Candidatus Sedimenticola endophacoides]|uniref:Helicase n=1 Tax=Candidatus Sedimenticola endophacoides TaxID=2548426 RepID=A0A657Q2I2_9GAMM|nr:MAG: helicase [Candidatus Sedimenticola endophacoides]OQX34948.1 MAG: helicase [Candidatus Sedimenticola endophacoides]OQX40526.1 MAG: helicase [Candidatus Sedimenticola endophacoides]OQX45161.1 MAG: helicase [Candidatus Sedimenticola endophacoides]OQX48829.1 MAG: helicase [Candidatus Sedimenticola endophacoides]
MSDDADCFLFDAEQLHAVADARELREGLIDFRQRCVTEMERDDQGLGAEVEDSDTGEVYQVLLGYDAEGNLLVTCGCDYPGDGLCRHGVALLYAYAAGQGDELLGAVDDAIEERVRRGRSEVRVKPLSEGTGFGTWQASSITPSSHYSRSYRVNIRSLERRSNYCNCPDFATNQLGTCKHIEAVLHRLEKMPKRTREAKHIQRPYVFLDWDCEDPPLIALHRGELRSGKFGSLLDEYFDAMGRMTGPLPERFFDFEQQCGDQQVIDIGEDARDYARQLSSRAAHRVRAREIHEQINSSGGHLPGLQARLYPYQVEGVAFLAANGRALLADDMGLGKTLQSIAAARWLHDHAGARRILVACPASLKQQWAREIERFTGMPAQVIQGGPQARGVQYRRGDGFFILNYELILRDLSIINEVLRPDLLILDEAQRIKNWRTKIASAVKLISSRYAFVLSGTPLENRLEDLYSLMQVVDPQVLGPLWRYLVDFHVTDERGKVLGYRNLSELRRRLRPVMLRRDRRLVQEHLPARVQQRLDVTMTQRQRELHDDALSAAGSLASIAKRRPLTPGEQNRLMAALQTARMACDAAALVDRETKGAPKLDELAGILDELCLQGGRKAVVFSQWEGMTRLVEQRLHAMGLGCVRLHGGVPTGKRGALMDRFREDDAVQVFISTDAGGVGLNLQSASVLVNLDIPWNPAVLEQRIARIHRLGQSESVQVILLVSTDSYEERVYSLVQNKQILFDNVVDPDGEEDVVGVSPKLLELVTDDLANFLPSDDSAETGDEVTDDKVGASAVAARDSAEGGVKLAIRRAIEVMQEHFGTRLERVLGTGGGLLAVVDRVESMDDSYATALSDRLEAEYRVNLPLALVDPLTLRGLGRLGAASPVQEGEVYFDAGGGNTQGDGSRLLRLAREHVQSATLLLQGQSTHGALELLTSALLMTAAARAGAAQPPPAREAAVWLYSELLPNGCVREDQAALIMRTIGLTQSEQVPVSLLEPLLGETRAFVETPPSSPGA